MTAFPAGIRAALRRFWTKREPEVFSFHQEGVLGTSFELRVRSCFREAADEAERRALAEIDRLELIFSVFDPTSEFRQWQAQRGREIRISPELLYVLQACDSWREKSAGAFNAASEIFSEVWRKAVRENRRPSADELSFCAHQASQVLWRLDQANQTAVYLAECPLNLNGIAKGYIVDRACEAALGEIGEREIIRGVTLSIGGDLRIHSEREETAGVSDPDNDAENAPLFACVRLREGALATSGDWRRGFLLGETFHSHIMDPRTGLPVAHIRSASVIAPSAADTDALATVFSVLQPDESILLADSLPGVGCLLIGRTGQVWRSAEWRNREVSAGRI